MTALDYLAPFALVALIVLALVLMTEWPTLTPRWRTALAVVMIVLACGLAVWAHVDCAGSWQECTR